MSVITFPDDLVVSSMRWEQRRNEVIHESPFGSQSQEISGPLWAVSIGLDRMYESESGKWKALLMRLKGRQNLLALWDVARPVPRGTMRGTMTLNADVAQGATSFQILAPGEPGKTLLQGDWLGLGSGLTQQVVMVTEDAAADGSGLITVEFESPLRNAFLSGAVIEWNKPKALFRRQNSVVGWDYESVLASGFGLDLLEDWRV